MLTMFLNADLSVKQIQEMVNRIHEKRVGVELETLVTTKEPFVRLQEENNISTFVIPVVKNMDAKLELHAIVNGKAYINDSWLKVDENILGYQLKYIGNKGVVLRNENHIKKLFLSKKKNSFIELKERY
jgi:predicted RNA-binding protein Jag